MAPLSVEPPKRIRDSIAQFTGRAWLLLKLLEWWDRNDQRIFLLTAGPSTGKSMILAWLAGYGPAPAEPLAAGQLEQLRKVVKAAHFLSGIEPEYHTTGVR
jgi:hypothetical protein